MFPTSLFETKRSDPFPVADICVAARVQWAVSVHGKGRRPVSAGLFGTCQSAVATGGRAMEVRVLVHFARNRDEPSLLHCVAETVFRF